MRACVAVDPRVVSVGIGLAVTACGGLHRPASEPQQSAAWSEDEVPRLPGDPTGTPQLVLPKLAAEHLGRAQHAVVSRPAEDFALLR